MAIAAVGGFRRHRRCIPRAHGGAWFAKFGFIVANYVAALSNMIAIGTSIFNVWDMNGF
jgi:hypothetical protein